MSQTKVIFRKWRSEPHSIIALFPELPSDPKGIYCESYGERDGWGAASYHGVIAQTVPAEPMEYIDMYSYLVENGMDVTIYRRGSATDTANRKAALKAMGY